MKKNKTDTKNEKRNFVKTIVNKVKENPVETALVVGGAVLGTRASGRGINQVRRYLKRGRPRKFGNIAKVFSKGFKQRVKQDYRIISDLPSRIVNKTKYNVSKPVAKPMETINLNNITSRASAIQSKNPGFFKNQESKDRLIRELYQIENQRVNIINKRRVEDFVKGKHRTQKWKTRGTVGTRPLNLPKDNYAT